MSTNNLTQSLLEDTTLLFASSNDNQLMVADGGSATFTYTFKVSFGKLVLGSTAGVTYSGNSTDTITLTGTTAAINAAINGLVYSPTANYFGTDTLSVLNGSATAMTFSLGITSVNDVPVTTEPSTTQSFNEDTPLVFNTANSNAITVANTNTVAALKFDGTSTSFLALPDAKLSGDITIEAWVTVANVYRNWQYIFDFGNGKDVNNIFLAFHGVSGHLTFGNFGDLHGLQYITAPSTLTDGTHHVAVGVSAQGWATLYVDGLAVTSGMVGVIANVARVNNFVGMAEGELRDVRIWDTERTQLQIQGNMQVLGDPGTSGLRAWYPMSETSGTTVANTAPAALNSAPVTRPAAVTHTTQAANLTTTLTATNGKLSLGNTVSGANVINGVNNSETITLSGSAVQINAAISGLSYTPKTDYFGTAALTVMSSDGSSARTKTINFNIADVDDNITFSGNLLALTESDAVVSTSGTVVTSATGSGAAFAPQANALGNDKRGKFTLASTGAWSYTTNAAHDELSAGESYTDTLSIKLANGTPSILTVKINGANDAPIITANSSERKFDEDTVYAFSGLNAITVSDADKIRALNFDGTNTSFLSLPDAKLSGDITLEAWVDVSNVYRGWQRIFDFGNGASANNIILCFDGDTGRLRFENIDSPIAQKTLVAPAVFTSGWHHVAVSVSAAGLATIYVDGVSTATGNVGVIPLVARANNYVGKSNWTSDLLFVGTIRDVRVWDVARSQADIKAAMQTLGTPGTTGLRAWYPMNEADGDVVINAATASGALTGAPVSLPAAVKRASVAPGQSATFTATNGTLELGSTSSGTNITAGNNKSATLTLSGTAAQINTAINGLKFNPTANYFGAADLKVSVSDGITPPTLRTINLTVNSVEDALITGNSITISETNAVLTATGKLALTGAGFVGAEPFVAQTNVAGSQGYGSFSLSSSGNWSYTTTTAHNEFAAGILYMDRLSVASVNGTIGTLAVNILGTNDAPEITVPSAVQTLDEVGKVVFSSKVAAGNATNNAITVVDPDVVTSQKFDGTSESYLAVADTKLSGDITLEAWINVTNVNRSWQRIFDFGNGAGVNNLILGFKGNSGRLIFQNFDNKISTNSFTTGSTLSNGMHHVAVSVSSGGVGFIYVDGVKAGWGNVGAVLGVARSNNYIGKSNWGASDPTFLGQMWDVRIWDTARSELQIKTAMNTPVDPDAAGLRAWYAMNETTGNTVANSAMVTVDDMLSVEDTQLISAPVTRRSGVTPATASTFLTTTLTTTQGTLAVGGASNTSGTIVGNTITLRGSAAEINAAMDGLVYTSPLSAGGTITVTTSDGTASDSDSISIKALQTLTLSGTIASASITGANTLAAFAGITIGNAVATHTLTARITLSPYVTLKTPGGFSYASGLSSATESVWTASGTAAQIKDMFNEVRVGATAENMVLPGAAVPFAMRLQVNNAIGNATLTGSASHIEAGDTPLIDMGSNSSISIDDTAIATPFSTFTLSDPNAIEGMTVAVTVRNPVTAAGVNRGEFTNYIALGFSKTSERPAKWREFLLTAFDTYTLALPGGLKGGAVAAATQAAVRALVYKPTAGVDPGDTSSTLMMQVQASQGFPAANGVTPVTVAVASVLRITSTNSAPTLELNSTGQRVNASGGTVTPFTDSVVLDANSTQTVTLKVALDNTLGSLNNAISQGMTLVNNGLPTAYYSKEGLTPAAAQTLLRSLSYRLTAASASNPVLTVTVTDSSGSASTAQATQALTLLSNSPFTLTGGITGAAALAFDGTSHYVVLPDPGISKDITLEAWVNMTDASRSWQRIFDLGNGAGSNNIILGFSEDNGKPFFHNYYGINEFKRLDAPSALTGGWHHVAVSVASDGNATLYVDGASVASGNVGEVSAGDRTTSYIGKSNWASNALFQGQMRDLRVWNVARTAVQINAQMGTWNASAPESISSGSSSATGLVTWIPVSAADAVANRSIFSRTATQVSPPPPVRLGNVTVNLGRASGWLNGPSINGLQAGTAVWNGGNATPLEQLVLSDGSSATTLTVTVAWATANGSATINGSTYSSGSTLTYTATGTSSASAVAQAALRTLSFSPSTVVAQSSSLQTSFTLTATNSALASVSSAAASVVQYGDRQRITLSGLPGDAVFSDEESISPFLQTTLTDPLGIATGTTRLVTARVVLTDNAVGGDFTSYKGFTRSQTQETSTSGLQVSVVVYTARGTVSDVQSLLQLLSYRGNLEARLNSSSVAASATAAVRLELDEGGGQVATASFGLTNQLSNQIPQLAVATPVWGVNEGTATNPLSDVTVTDADATSKTQPITVYVQMVGSTEKYAVSKMANLVGFAQDAAATKVAQTTAARAVVFTRTFSGTTAAADAQAALRAFSFNPDKYHATPGQSSASTFSVWANDGVYTSATVSTTVNATAINTPIGLTGGSTSLRTVDGRGFAPFSSLVIVDPDLGESITATLSLSDPTAGVLTNLSDYFAISTVNTDSNGTTTSYTIAGVAATVMAALNGVKFTPNNAPIASSRSATLNLQVEDAANNVAKAATTITINSADVYLMPDVTLASAAIALAYTNNNVKLTEASNGLANLKLVVELTAGSKGAQVVFADPVYTSGTTILKIGPPVRQDDDSYYWDLTGSAYSQGNFPTPAQVQDYLRAATLQGSPDVQARFKARVVQAEENIARTTYVSGAKPYVFNRDLATLGNVTGVPTTATELLVNPMIRWPLADLVVTTQAGSGENNLGVTGLSISLAKTAGGSTSSNAGLVFPSELSVSGSTVITSPTLVGGQWRWDFSSQSVRPSTAQLQAYLRGVRIQNYTNDNATWAVSFTQFTESIGGVTRTASAATLGTAFANELALTFVPGTTLGGNSSEIRIYSVDGTSGISAVDNSNTSGQQVLIGIFILDSDLTATETVTVSLSNPSAGAFSAASLGSETDASGYFTADGSGVYTYSGSAANASTAIQRLSFVASSGVESGKTRTTKVTVNVSRPNPDGTTTSMATPASVTVVAGNQSAVFSPDPALILKNGDVPTFTLLDVLQLQPFAKGALLETVSGYNTITVNVVVSDSTVGVLGSPVGTATGYGFIESLDQSGLTSPQKRYTYTQPKAELGKPLAYDVLRDAVFTPQMREAGDPVKVTLSVSVTVDGVTMPVEGSTSFMVKPTAYTLALQPSFSGNVQLIRLAITSGKEGDYLEIDTAVKFKGFTVKTAGRRAYTVTPPAGLANNEQLVKDLLSSIKFVNNGVFSGERTFSASVVTTDGRTFNATGQATVTFPERLNAALPQAMLLPAWVNTPFLATEPDRDTYVSFLKASKASLVYGMIAVRMAGLSLNFSKQTNLIGYLGADEYLKLSGETLAFEKSNKLSDWTEGFAPDPRKPWRVHPLYYVEGLANHIMYTPYFEVFNNMGAHRAISVRAKIVIGAILTAAINSAVRTENQWTDRFGRAEHAGVPDGNGKYWREVGTVTKTYDLFGTLNGLENQHLKDSAGAVISITDAEKKTLELREIEWRAEFVSTDYNGKPTQVRLIPYNLDRSLWNDPKYLKYIYRDTMVDGSATNITNGRPVDSDGNFVAVDQVVFVTDANGVVQSVTSKTGKTIVRYENPLFQSAKMAEKQSRLIYATNILSFVGVAAMFSLFALSAVQMKMQGKSDGEIVLLLTEAGLAGAIGAPVIKGLIQYSLLYSTATLVGAPLPTFYKPGFGYSYEELLKSPRHIVQGYTTETVDATRNAIKNAITLASNNGADAINAGMKGRALIFARGPLMLAVSSNLITEAIVFVVSMFVSAVVAAQSGKLKDVLAALEAQFYTKMAINSLDEYRLTGSAVNGQGTYMEGRTPTTVDIDGTSPLPLQYAAGSNKSETLFSSDSSYSTMFITGMGRDKVYGSANVVDTIVGGFSGIDDLSRASDASMPVLGYSDLATERAVYDGGEGSSNALSLQEMGPYMAKYEDQTYMSTGGRRIVTVYSWLAVDVSLETGTVWASGFKETESVDTAFGFDVNSSKRTRESKIFSGVEIKNIDTIIGNNLNVTFTSANDKVDADGKVTKAMTSTYFGSDGNSIAQGGTGTNKFFGGLGANLFSSGTGTNEFTTGIGPNDFFQGAGTEHTYLTADAGNTVIRYLNTEGLKTATDGTTLTRPDSTDDDELWFPAGVMPTDLAFIPVENRSLGVNYGGSGGVILDGFFKSYDHRMGKFVFSMPNGAVDKVDAYTLVSSAGFLG